MRTSRIRGRLAWAVGVATLVTVAGGIGYASVNNVIYGCVNKKSGDLRVVADPGACDGREFAIDWDRRGEPGPEGPQGPQGPQGQKGDKGDPGGLSGYEVVRTSTVTVSPELKNSFVWASCPSGKIITGGGVENTAGDVPLTITHSYPGQSSGGNWIAWGGGIRNDGTTNVSFRVYAICVNA